MNTFVYKNVLLLVIMTFILIGAGYIIAKQNNNQSQMDNDISKEKSTASSWQTFDEEKNGVRVGVLPNFQYPQEWFTYNAAGGQSVAIHFSDGGIYVEQNLDKSEIASELRYTEYGDQPREESNECKLSVTYNGSKDSYFITRLNTKVDPNKKLDCESILTKLEEQVPKGQE